MDPVDFVQAIILGVVQGATEFLPVSSSGHLVLVPWLLGWPDPGLAFDAVVHWGTLVSVVVYFHEDLLVLARGWLASVRERRLSPAPVLQPTTTSGVSGAWDSKGASERRLAWLILIGTLPAVIAGLLFEDMFTRLFSRPPWAARFLLLTGLLLVAAEWVRNHRVAAGRTNRLPLAALTLAGALTVGVAQAFAIAPGISRSGATIAAGLLVGLGRRDAARFSFLLATPIILGAGLLQLLHLLQAGNAVAEAPALAAGFLAAAVTGFLAIRFLLDYLQRHTLYVFAVYCWIVALGGLLLAAMR